MLTVYVDDTVADADDWMGAICESSISANASAPCNLRGAFGLCTNFDLWASNGTSIDGNRCDIVIRENSVLMLDTDLMPPLFFTSMIKYAAWVTVRAEGYGATIIGSQMMFTEFSAFSSSSTITLSLVNLKFVYSMPSIVQDYGGAIYMSGVNMVCSTVDYCYDRCFIIILTGVYYGVYFYGL